MMRGLIFFFCLFAFPVFSQVSDEIAPPVPIVFFDIAGPDSSELAGFYASVFNWQIASDGSLTAHIKSPPLVPSSDFSTANTGFSTSVTAPLPGQVRSGPAEKRIYLGVADVAESLDAIEALGGTVEAGRFEVPGVVVLGLFQDPAGNPMGLVEMDGDRVKIP